MQVVHPAGIEDPEPGPESGLDHRIAEHAQGAGQEPQGEGAEGGQQLAGGAIRYNIWQVANPTLADLVTVSKGYTVYRTSGAALTRKGGSRPIAGQFLDYLQAPDGAAIFRKWGWMVP